MRILIACGSMNHLSGSPIYNYELALELVRQGHEVHLASWFFTPEVGSETLKQRLEDGGVRLHQTSFRFDTPSVNADLAILSQSHTLAVAQSATFGKIINVVHSEYDVEAPILNSLVNHYIAIRPQIKDHLTTKYNLEPDKIAVIGNGVDTARFNPKKRLLPKRSYRVTVAPCTFDPLRQKFIEDLAATASSTHKVVFVGQPAGVDMPTGPMIQIVPPMFNIEAAIGQADKVAGILLGRVNLEAMMMGVPSTIYDPDTLKATPWKTGYDPEYDIKTVARKITSLAN